jgi:hypothetical protein
LRYGKTIALQIVKTRNYALCQKRKKQNPLSVKQEVYMMDKRYCADCQWFSPEDHICLSEQSDVFLTHETDTCQYWEDYDYDMYGDMPQRDGGGSKWTGLE